MAEIALAGATAVLKQTVGVLSNLVFKEDIVWIEREMRHIQAFLEDAKAKQGGSRGVANLVIDIRDLACDVEDIMQKYFPRIGSKEEDINRVRQTYGINESSGSGGRDMWDERRSFPHIDEPNVAGFEKHIEDLVAKMLNKELQCRVISIIGMAGLGKTTLAKKKFKSAQHNFKHSPWIYVSQQPNIKELLQDIAQQVDLDKEKQEENFENVIPTNTKNGSRIILTSHNNYVGTHVGGKSSLYELRPLNEENNIKLFFKMVLVEVSDPPQLENIAKGSIQGSGVREVEDVRDDYLNHLIARNLIQVVQRRFDGKVRSCRIHDILHNICIREAKEINFFDTQNDVITCNRGMGVHRVTTHGSNFGDCISLNYRTPKLRSMLSLSGDLSFVERKMVKNFLRDFEFLQVLSVMCDYLLRPLPNELIVEEGGMPRLKELGFFQCNPITAVPNRIKNIMKIDNW
ncbi:hypothetical protein ACSBR2_005689 [Camellia fascicularis]